jgi:hypothetical protein
MGHNRPIGYQYAVRRGLKVELLNAPDERAMHELSAPGWPRPAGYLQQCFLCRPPGADFHRVIAELGKMCARDAGDLQLEYGSNRDGGEKTCATA